MNQTDLFINRKLEYPTLYARSETGAVLEWNIVVEGNTFYTVTGQQDGKKIESEKTSCQGKNTGKSNETTPESQAIAEAEAKWKKKLKSGYWEDVKDIDKNKYIEPILAKSYKDYIDKIDFSKQEWGAQNKYNGICALISINGAYTRKGERFVSIPHIENILEPFFKKYPLAVLHGEMFNDDYRQKLNEISKLCRKTVHVTDEDLKQSELLIRFYIYDGYGFIDSLNESAPYKKRKEFIDTEVIGKYDYCVHVPTIPIHNKEQLNKEFEKRIIRGDEGLILRKMDMPYEHKRSKNLLKYKPENDDEGIILDIEEGVGNWANTGKIIKLKWKDKIFNATFKGTYEDGVKFLKDKDKWINKVITFQYMGLTGLGIPNYARVDINNCIKGDR